MFFSLTKPDSTKPLFTSPEELCTHITHKVYARVNEICKNVIPGMYVNAMIEVEGMQVAAIPSEAFVSFEDTDYTFVFDKNKEESSKPWIITRILLLF